MHQSPNLKTLYKIYVKKVMDDKISMYVSSISIYIHLTIFTMESISIGPYTRFNFEYR